MATEIQEARVRVRLDTKDALAELDKLKAEQERRNLREKEIATDAAREAFARPRAAPSADDTPSDGRSSSPEATQGGSRPPSLADAASMIVRSAGVPSVALPLGAQVAASNVGAASAATVGAAAVANQLSTDLQGRAREFATGATGSSLAGRAADALVGASIGNALLPGSGFLVPTADVGAALREIRAQVAAVSQTLDTVGEVVFAGSALGSLRPGELVGLGKTYHAYAIKMEREERERANLHARISAGGMGEIMRGAVLDLFLLGGR